MVKKLVIALITVLILIMTVSAAEITITDITDLSEQDSAAVTASNGTRHFPVEISSTTDDGVKLICKTFEVEPEVSPYVLAEENLTQNGTEYVLRDILRKASSDNQEKKTASQSVTVDADSDKTADILKLLQPILNYSENGFTGELALDESSIRAEVSSTSAYRYAVTDTRINPNLARNDPALIAKTVQKNGVTLSLCNVNWSGGNENESSPVYSATATYKGSANGSRASGYTATASYSGEVVKTTPGNVMYTLVYAAVPKPVVLPEKIDFTMLWISLGAVIFIGLIGAGIYYLFFKRKRRSLPTDGNATVISKRIHIPMALSHQDISEEDSDENDD